MRAIWRTFSAVLMATVVVISLAGAVPVAASAEPGETCFEVNNPRWDALRTMADQFAKDGTLTQETADAYKCDPRLAIQATMSSVKVTIEIPDVMVKGCGNTAGIIYQAPSVGPIAIVHRQDLYWCWDGWTVSGWGGACDGWATGWGSVNGWSYDGCVTNDFIPYTLAGRFPGGVHHYTKAKFSNWAPWVPNQYLAVSTWGHFDGTWDYAVH